MARTARPGTVAKSKLRNDAPVCRRDAAFPSINVGAFAHHAGCCMLMANVLRKLIRESSLLAPDFPSFKRQESAFVVLNLFILSVLLLIHTLFSSYFGTPPRSLIIVLAIGFLLNVVELIWLQSATFLGATEI